MRGNNLPIVDLSKFYTEGKEAHKHPNKPHCGKTQRKQKDDGREHKEGGIQLHARFESTDFQNNNLIRK